MAKQGAQAVTPKLRFPEFRGSDAWTVDTLASAARLVKDKIAVEKLCLDNYVSTENLVPDYGGVTVATKLPDVGSVTHFKRDDVLISNIRPYLRKVWQADRDGGASNDVIVLRRKSIISDAFLALVLRNDAFIAYVMESAKGVKMPRGDIDAMRAYKVAHPEPAEQNKIADCLTSLDEVIAAQGRKVESLKAHKRGLMQQLFPREGETRPRLRFPEFRNAPEWRGESIGKLGRFLPALSGKTASDFDCGDAKFIPYSNVFEHAFIDAAALRAVNVSAGERQNKVKKGDVFFTVSSETPADAGMSSVLLEDISECYLNSFSALFRFSETTDVNSVFAGYFFRSPPVRAYLASNAQGAIRYNISKSVFQELQLLLPSLEEQQHIADCLASLDTRITAETNQLAALKTHKQGLMQQLFPAPEMSCA